MFRRSLKISSKPRKEKNKQSAPPQQQQYNKSFISNPSYSSSSQSTTTITTSTDSTKLRRSSTLLSKLIRKSSTCSSNSNNIHNNNNSKANIQPIPLFEPSSPESSLSSSPNMVKDLSSYYSSSSSSSTNLINDTKPMEQLPPDWELRYDTLLCQFYYVNTVENIVQFDSPLEVIKR